MHHAAPASSLPSSIHSTTTKHPETPKTAPQYCTSIPTPYRVCEGTKFPLSSLRIPCSLSYISARHLAGTNQAALQVTQRKHHNIPFWHTLMACQTSKRHPTPLLTKNIATTDCRIRIDIHPQGRSLGALHHAQSPPQPRDLQEDFPHTPHLLIP